MSDPRLTASNGRVALAALRGVVAAERFVEGEIWQVSAPVADLLRKPGGGLDRQLLRGAAFRVLESDAASGFAFGQNQRDSYVGYVALDDLWQPVANTHKVASLGSQIYDRADIKSRALAWLPFGAEVAVAGSEGRFLALIDGSFVPEQHLVPLHHCETGFVSVLERFLGIPYLWGGNSTLGMDCSGAVQLALEACGQACPRDSDMQEAALGRALPADAPLQRGDLIFWRTHVGVMVDPTRLIHANAHHMAVTIDKLDDVAARVRAAGDGGITSRRRL